MLAKEDALAMDEEKMLARTRGAWWQWKCWPTRRACISLDAPNGGQFELFNPLNYGGPVLASWEGVLLIVNGRMNAPAANAANGLAALAALALMILGVVRCVQPWCCVVLLLGVVTDD